MLHADIASISSDIIGLIGHSIGGLIFDSLLWGMVFAFIGFVLAVILIIVVARRNWLHRKPVVWNVLAKLYYVVIFCSCIVLGGAVGAVYGVHRDIEHTVNQSLRPLLDSSVPALRQYFSAQLEKYSPEQEITASILVEKLVADFYYQPTSSSWWETTKADTINWVVLHVGAEGLTLAINTLLAKALDKTGDTLGVDKQTLRITVGALREMDLTRLDSTIPQIITQALNKQLTHIFTPMYLHIGLVLLLILVLIATDILIYYRIYLPSRTPRPNKSTTDTSH